MKAKQATKAQGLAAVLCDERLTDTERGQWIDLCMTEHETGARVRAMYVRRMAGTPRAVSADTYAKAHAEHMAALRAVEDMRQRFGGFIAWPTNA